MPNHCNLEYYRKPQNLTRRQADWISQLQEYHIELCHRPGRLHGQADFFSRPPNIDKGTHDNEQVISLPDTLFRVTKITNITEQSKILSEYHDSPLSGHPGKDKTIELIQRVYDWDTIKQDVADYVKACPGCQMNKPHRHKTKAPLHPVDPGSIPFSHISVDLISPLPVSNSFDTILVIVDKSTKKAVFIPTVTTLTSKGYAKLLVHHWIRHFGLPCSVTSDRGPQFVAQFIQSFYDTCGIRGSPSTAYHPQTDGQTERVNQELKIYLRFYINSFHDNWHEWLPLAEFSYNDKTHSTTSISPHFATLGIHPWKGDPQQVNEPRNPAGSDFASELQTIRERAHKSLKAAQATAKAYYDRKRAKSWNLRDGDLVWLDGTHITPVARIKKLSPRRYGPFPIIKRHGPSSFELRLPAAWSRLHPVFNEALLTPYTPPITPGQAVSFRPTPEIIDDTEHFEVEYLTDFKMMRRKPFYKVHWAGYPSFDDSWEPLANLLPTAEEAVRDFHAANPTHPFPSALVARSRCLPRRHTSSSLLPQNMPPVFVTVPKPTSSASIAYLLTLDSFGFMRPLLSTAYP